MGIEADGGWRMADSQSAASLHYDDPGVRVTDLIPQKEIGNRHATRQGHSCPTYPRSAIRYPLPSLGIEADGGWRMADSQSAASLHGRSSVVHVSDVPLFPFDFIPQNEIGNGHATREGHSCPTYRRSADSQSAASLHYDYPVVRVTDLIPQQERGSSYATRHGQSCLTYPLSAIRYPLLS